MITRDLTINLNPCSKVGDEIRRYFAGKYATLQLGLDGKRASIVLVSPLVTDY